MQPRNHVLAAVFIAVIAFPAAAETLADIYAVAKQSDPRYLATRAEFEATGFAKTEARAGLLPQIAGSKEFTLFPPDQSEHLGVGFAE